MKYEILLRKDEGICKVTDFECRAEESPIQLALYLFRHYPVRFYDDKLSEDGDTERILKDTRTGYIVWRQGDMECKMKEGYFYLQKCKEEKDSEMHWWEKALPKSKKIVIEADIQNSYKKGFNEGYNKGIEEGKEEGYRKGVLDAALCNHLN